MNHSQTPPRSERWQPLRISLPQGTRLIALLTLSAVAFALQTQHNSVLAQTDKWDNEFTQEVYLVHVIEVRDVGLQGENAEWVAVDRYQIVSTKPEGNEFSVGLGAAKEEWRIDYLSEKTYKTYREVCTTVFARETESERVYWNFAVGTNDCRLLTHLGAAISFPCYLELALPNRECEALKSIYLATNGPQWKEPSPHKVGSGKKWISVYNPCVWDRVTCDQGHVTKLRLDDAGLSGSLLSATFADLPYLAALYMGNNEVGGVIPAQLSGLDYLRVVDMQDNQLEGTIPEGLLGDQDLPESDGFTPETARPALRLNDNLLSGPLPKDLGRKSTGNLQSSLRDLYVYNNPQLTGPVPSTYPTDHEFIDFRFNNTDVCEPQDQTMQKWLDSRIQEDRRTSQLCANQAAPLTIKIPTSVVVYTLNGGKLTPGVHPLQIGDELTASCPLNEVVRAGGTGGAAMSSSQSACPLVSGAPPDKVQLSCTTSAFVLADLFLPSTDTPEDERKLVMHLLRAVFAEELCDGLQAASHPRTSAISEPHIEIDLDEGGLGIETIADSLHIQVQTAVVTVDSEGRNTFSVLHDPGSGASRVTANRGQIQITAAEPGDSPFDLHQHQQAEIDESGVNSIRDPSLIFLPSVTR